MGKEGFSVYTKIKKITGKRAKYPTKERAEVDKVERDFTKNQFTRRAENVATLWQFRVLLIKGHILSHREV